MNRIITTLIFTAWGILLTAPVIAQDPPALFEYNVSTAEAFYFVQYATIDGVPLDYNDWIGAFNGNVCVGSVQWSGEYTEVPVMGDDGDLNSDGYLLPGQYPDFMIYDASEDQFYDALPSENFGWANLDFYFITNLNAIIPDCFGTPGGTAFYDDCGQCIGGETGMDENWAMDDCGVCFGYNNDMDCNSDCFGAAFFDACEMCSGGLSGHEANSDMDCNGDCFGESLVDDCGDCVLPENFNGAMDECGVCNGSGIPDGDCDCDGNVLDCTGVCGGGTLIDDCGVCDGPGAIYECGCTDIPDGDCDCDGNVPDCAGVCGGNSVVDDCGICDGNNADMDCAGECFGGHLLDPDEACCLAEEMDFCGLCFGENQCAGNGDINGDGSLDVLDAVRLISIIMQQITPTEYELWTADLIWDGSIDVLDAVNLISLIMGG